MKRSTRALVMALLFCVTLCLSFACVAVCLDHDCTGRHCVVCLAIGQCAQFLRQAFGAALVWVGLRLVAPHLREQRAKNLAGMGILVMMKVELLN